MSPHDIVADYLNAHRAAIRALDPSAIEAYATALLRALDHDRTVFLFGNGGSAAASSHFAVDLAKGFRPACGRRLRVRCLVDSIAVLTAYANDVAYEDVFVEPLRSELREGDLVVALSGSGDSENVIRAVRFAREAGATVVGICGFGGGRLRGLADICVHLPVDDMFLTEDVQIAVNHATMRALAAMRE